MLKAMYRGNGPIKENMRRSFEFGNPSAELCKKIYNIGFWKAPKMNIKISGYRDIDYTIGLRWYNRVQVIGYFVDFVSYKYQTKSKLFHKYLKSTKLRKIDLSKISYISYIIYRVFKNQHRPALGNP